jgi:hypothetical protein
MNKSLRIFSLAIAVAALLVNTGSAGSKTRPGDRSPNAVTASIIRIAGSTAFRTSTHKAIEDILNPGFQFVYKNKGGTSEFKASAAIFSGTLKSNSAAVIIKTFWTGSMAGVIDLSQQNNISSWIDNSELPPAHANGFNFDAASYVAESPAAPPQVALTDADKLEVASSVATATGGAAVSNTIKTAGLIDGGSAANAGGAGTVGVVPFVWCKGVGAPAAVANVTQQVAAELIKTGSVPIAAFTNASGNSAGPLTDFAFLIGRSEDSGTRITSFAEGQTNFGKSTAQYRISFDSGSSYTDNSQTVQTGGTGANMNGLKLWDPNWPVNTAPTISWTDSGHAGYIAGGDVVNVLKATSGQPLTPTTGAPSSSFFTAGTSKCYLFGYAGFADAAGLPAAQRLSYNGVAYSVANVQNGTYSLWGFEHLYYRPALGSDVNAKQAADDLADKIFLVDAPTDANGATDNSGANTGVAGILFDTSFNFTRSGTGAYLTPF